MYLEAIVILFYIHVFICWALLMVKFTLNLPITRQHCQCEYWNSNRLGISQILQHLSILCLSVGNLQEFNDEINFDIPHMYVSMVVDILTFLEWNYESPIYASLS